MINSHGKTFSNQSYHYNVLSFSENRPLCGATQAMVLQGQNNARKRVCLFFTIYIITGFMGIATNMSCADLSDLNPQYWFWA